METYYERLVRYTKEGFPLEAMNDSCWLIRLGYFEEHGFTEESKTDKDWKIRQEAKIRLKKELDMELIKSISRTELEEMYRELLDYIQGLDSSAYEESSKCYLLNLQKWFINKINENN